MVLEKTLESPLDSKEINQSIQKETNPEYSLEGVMLMLKLKVQYFGYLMLGKMEGRRRREQQRRRWLNSITDSMDMNLCKPWEMVKDREAWRAVVHGVMKSWT